MTTQLSHQCECVDEKQGNENRLSSSVLQPVFHITAASNSNAKTAVLFLCAPPQLVNLSV